MIRMILKSDAVFPLTACQFHKEKSICGS